MLPLVPPKQPIACRTSGVTTKGVGSVIIILFNTAVHPKSSVITTE